MEDLYEMLFIAHISLVVGITYSTVLSIIVGTGSGLSILLLGFSYYILFYHNPVFKNFLEKMKEKYNRDKKDEDDKK